jgi:transposase
VVAESLEVTPGAVSQWIKAYKERGEDGLKSKSYCGSMKLSEEKLSLLPQLAKNVAPAFGYSENLTTKRIASKVKVVFPSHPIL